jgi:hypothetical protein
MAKAKTQSSSYDVIEINSWEMFQNTFSGSKFRTWAFRGQENSDWPLFSSLSRYLRDFKVHPEAWSRQEDRIVRIFKRKAHLFLDHIPDLEDDFQWLALMQHHGAPTRLLDFTWSPFVACFFAFERATLPAAIWAVHPGRIFSARIPAKSKEAFIEAWKFDLRDRGNYRKYYLEKQHTFVLHGDPFVLNQRMVAQSGTFVYSSDLDLSIDQILSNYPNPEKFIVKFILDTEKLRDHAMYELFNMNITNATLFPGLDGLTRSLAYELEFHWRYNPKSMKEYND